MLAPQFSPPSFCHGCLGRSPDGRPGPELFIFFMGFWVGFSPGFPCSETAGPAFCHTVVSPQRSILYDMCADVLSVPQIESNGEEVNKEAGSSHVFISSETFQR